MLQKAIAGIFTTVLVASIWAAMGNLVVYQVPCDLPVSNTVQLQYEQSPVTTYSDGWWIFKHNVTQVAIKNLDSDSGNFVVNFKFSAGSILKTSEVSQKIVGGTTAIFSSDVPSGTVVLTPEIIAPFKTVTNMVHSTCPKHLSDLIPFPLKL